MKAYRFNLGRSKTHFTTAVDYSEPAQEKKYYSKYVFIAERGNLILSNISNHIHQTLRPDTLKHKVSINHYKEERGYASCPCTVEGVPDQATAGKFQPAMVIHSGSPERCKGQQYMSKSLTQSCHLAKHAGRRKANISSNVRNNHPLQVKMSLAQKWMPKSFFAPCLYEAQC